MEIQAGDVVQLKSGGPMMTVTSVGETTSGVLSAWCSWFDGAKVMTGVFPVTALAKDE